MKKSYLRFYLVTLAILLVLSAYPLIQGLKIAFLQVAEGFIAPQDYARYVIPYTAICLSVLAVAALHPLVSKLKRLQVLAATALALGLFVGTELMMESVVINNPGVKSAVQWQLLSCVYTPSAVMAFQGVYSDAFKIHYFLVSFIMVVLIVNVVYCFGALAKGREMNKAPLVMQLAAAVLFVGLCVFANFTGFFRLPTDVQHAGSGLLTGLFFVVLGASAAIWAGSFLLKRHRLLSVGLPACIAVTVCAVMYWGEILMLGGVYRFGTGFFFDGLPAIMLAPFDLLVILLSGVVSALALEAMRTKLS